MTEPTKEQAWKEEARKAYQYQQSQDNEGGCRESIGFVQGYLAAKKSDFEEIKTLKEQLSVEIKQREKAEKVIIDLMDNTPHYDECSFMEDENCKCDCGREIDIKLARQYFAEKEKQDKENKDEK